MAYKRIVRKIDELGNISDDVSVKHADTTNSIGQLTEGQLATKAQFDQVKDAVTEIKIGSIPPGSSVGTTKVGNTVYLPNYVTPERLRIYNGTSLILDYDGTAEKQFNFADFVIPPGISNLNFKYGAETTPTTIFNGATNTDVVFKTLTFTYDVNTGSGKTFTTKTDTNVAFKKLAIFSSKSTTARAEYDTGAVTNVTFYPLRITVQGSNFSALYDPTTNNVTNTGLTTSDNELVLQLPPASAASVGTLTLQQNGSTVGTYTGSATTINFATFSTLNLGSATYIQGPGWSNSLAANFNGYRAITIMFSHVESDSSYAISSATFPLSSIIGGDRLRVVVVENGTIKWISLTPTTSPSLNQVTNWTISSSGSNWPNGTGILIVGMR
jgi:hypothetical protein